jgi:transcriptional regulator with XRE-family HTH domain
VNAAYTKSMGQVHPPNAVMARVRARFEKSELTYTELGQRMGYPPDTARQSAWQFISKTKDPHISVLYRFASAMGISVKDLL